MAIKGADHNNFKPKPVQKPVETKPAVKADPPKPAADPKPAAKTGKDETVHSDELKGGEKGNAKHLNALADTFGKDAETEKAKGGDKADKAEKGEKKPDPKTPEGKKEIQDQIGKLQDELKQAEAKGDKEAIKRLQGQIKDLQDQLNGDKDGNTNPGAPNPGNPGNAGGDPGGGAPGGGAPGGGAPAGGAPGGGAPAGGAPGGGDTGGPGAAGGPGGANEAGAGQQASNEEVNQFIQFAAQAYGADPKVLSEIARRESNFNTGDIANNWDSNAKKGTPSKGMFQFIQPTFESMAPQAKAANPGAWQGVSMAWTDWKAQALTCAWAITHGKGNQWSTYQAALNTAGGGGNQRMA